MRNFAIEKEQSCKKSAKFSFANFSWPTPTQQAELHVGVLLEKIIAATPYCTTDVCHFEMAGGTEWTAGKVTPVIGKTINATLALVSHSCYPTAARVCCENATLLIAQKNMRPGEAVTINYAAPFYAATRSDRRQYLTSGYELVCECEACRADWPLFDGLPPGPQGLPDVELAGDLQAGSNSPLAGGVRPVFFNSASSNNSSALINNGNYNNNLMLTKTEQHVMETFGRVRSRIEQLQRCANNRLPSEPPSKIMIQSQGRMEKRRYFWLVVRLVQLSLFSLVFSFIEY